MSKMLRRFFTAVQLASSLNQVLFKIVYNIADKPKRAKVLNSRIGKVIDIELLSKLDRNVYCVVSTALSLPFLRRTTQNLSGH